MKLAGKIVVVTGGGAGIGRALCGRFRREGAKAVVAAKAEDCDRWLGGMAKLRCSLSSGQVER